MSNLQEVKITNLNNETDVFFFKHSFKTALQHAEDYIKRNKNKFPMIVYTRSYKPKPSPLWILYKKE